MAVDRLPIDHPDRALVLAHCVQNSSTGVPSNGERLWPMRRWGSPHHQVTTPPLRAWSIIVFYPLLVPSMLGQQLALTEDALVRAERVGDPVLLFLVAHSRATAVFLAGDIDEMDRCIEIMCALAEQLDQPILSWTNTFHLAKPSADRRRYRPRRTVGDRGPANRTDCGQPDAAFFFAGQLMIVSTQRGTLGGLIPLIEQMVDEAPASVGC